MFKEKRQTKRIKEDFNIFCRVFRRVEFDASVSQIVDIGKGGICFQADNPITPGDLILMILRMPPTCKEKVELYGRVVACEPKDRQFKIHVAFIDIAPATKATLERIIEDGDGTSR